MGAFTAFLTYFCIVAAVLLINLSQAFQHEPLEVPQNKLSVISQLSNVRELKEIVKTLLVPRVVGTPGHKNVREYIIKSLKDLKWHVQTDVFEEETPIMGKLQFENVIATLNPDAERFIIYACHYDSKYMADHEFLGATDSAVPCAMLIYLAKILDQYFDEMRISENKRVSLMFVFFDGEEAFHQWGPEDSIYGARHLAAKWDNDGFLKKVDMLMLLDLLGAPDPKFYSFFKNTEQWYSRLVYAEDKLATNGFLHNGSTSGSTLSKSTIQNRYFQPRSTRSFIEDDHIPFLNLGVPILHLIPLPFPKVWHTKDDNHDIIDFNTVDDLCKVLKIFTLEFLQINLDNY